MKLRLTFDNIESFLISDFDEVEYMENRDFLNTPPFFPDSQNIVKTDFVINLLI